jgi:hypothetical protein
MTRDSRYSKLKIASFRKHILRFLLSFVLAYPLSGFTISLVSLARSPSLMVEHPLGALTTFIFGSVWFGVLTPIYGGFPIADEGGVNHLNMYPYIFPTACIVFFVISKGWRWFKPLLVQAAFVFGAVCSHRWR